MITRRRIAISGWCMMYREKKYLGIIPAREGSQGLPGKNSQPLRGELAMATRRKENEKPYFSNGVAYTKKTKTLPAEGTYYPNQTRWSKSKSYQRYEIDDISDSLIVEQIMTATWGLQ